MVSNRRLVGFSVRLLAPNVQCYHDMISIAAGTGPSVVRRQHRVDLSNFLELACGAVFAHIWRKPPVKLLLASGNTLYTSG